MNTTTRGKCLPIALVSLVLNPRRNFSMICRSDLAGLFRPIKILFCMIKRLANPWDLSFSNDYGQDLAAASRSRTPKNPSPNSSQNKKSRM